MNLDLIFHHQPLSDHANFRVLHLIFEKLSKTFPNNRYTVVNPYSLDIPAMDNAASLKGLLMLTIVNRDNNKAILINLADRLEPNILPDHGYDLFEIKQIIGGMSIGSREYENHKKFLDNYRLPLMIPVDKVSEDGYLMKYRDVAVTKVKKALFIGNVYSGRSELVDILKKHPLFEIKHSIREEGLPFEEYLREMSKYSLCLSLNGYAEICYRDIEAMAIQVPVVRSKFLNRYHNNLIPNFHYIAGSESCIDGFLGYGKSSKDIAEQFIKKVEEVIDNQHLLDSVAYNGREYYENNCNINAIVHNAMSLINLDLLK